jgi:hypothetical protein
MTQQIHRIESESTFAIRKLTGPNSNDPTRSYTVSIPHIWVRAMDNPSYVKLTRQSDSTISIERLSV